MDVFTAIAQSMERVLGIEREEVEELEQTNVDLLETGLLDSLSIVTLLSEVSACIGKKLEIRVMEPKDFSTVEHLVAAIERQLNCE